MSRSSAEEEQYAATEDVFGARRNRVQSEIMREDIDAWGSLAESHGMSASNIGRLQRLIAGEYATRLAPINAEERMFFANLRRMDEERRKANTRNTWTTIGSIVGGAGAAVAAPFTGGASLSLIPTFMQLGGSLGSFGAGLAVGEQDPNTAAGFAVAANAYGSYEFQRAIRELTAKVRGFAEDSETGWKNPYDAEDYLTREREPR